jgi:hypothetical protein
MSEEHKSCIGWGIYEDICQYSSFVEPYLWCYRCEKLRRKDISKQISGITKLFNNA